jgi:uncharacterized protein
MITRKDIEKFLEPKKMAIAGVSRNPKKFGYQVFKELINKGFEIYPVNPSADIIDGERCYHTVSEIPAEIKHLLILTPKSETDAILKEAIEKGFSNIWIQQMSETRDSLKITEGSGIHVISKKCIFMFTEPVTGVHKFHRTIMKWFGRLPK